MLGVVAGALRALLLTCGAYLLSEASDWRQPLGYFLTLFGLPEILLTRGLREQPFLWVSVSAGIVAASTVAWVTGAGWVVLRPGHRPTPKPGPDT